MAGQRGAGANAGLIARQAAQQGASTQQQAAGQAATLAAQQQIAARQQLAAQQAQMIGQQAQATGAYTGATQGEQQNILNAINAQNQASVSSQASVNAANAQLANTGLQGTQALIGGGLNAAGAGSAAAAGAEGGTVGYVDGGGIYVPTSSADYDAAEAAQNAPSTLTVPNAPAAPTVNNPTSTGPSPKTGPKSSFGQFLQNKNSSGQASYGNPGANALAQGMSHALNRATSGSSLPTSNAEGDSSTSSGYAQQYAPTDALGNQPPTSGGISQGAMNALQEAGENIGDSAEEPGMAKGGRVPALVSPGEQYLPPKDVKKVVKDGKNPLSVGERIPGKPKHPGNDYRNDTVKKTLQSGGMVIPNDVMQSKNPHFEAMKFVHAHIAKHRGLSK